MAILRLDDGTVLTDLSSIEPELAELKVTIRDWSTAQADPLLLAQASLSDAEKAIVLTQLDHYFEQLQRDLGYTSRDLIVLHPGIANLDAMLEKFAPVHTHADDEVRYIIEGEGIFGFVRADGSQVELTVQAAEYINVPAGTPHWFRLSDSLRVKAVRYFCGTAGWVPEYTGTAIKFQAPLLSETVAV